MQWCGSTTAKWPRHFEYSFTDLSRERSSNEKLQQQHHRCRLVTMNYLGHRCEDCETVKPFCCNSTPTRPSLRFPSVSVLFSRSTIVHYCLCFMPFKTFNCFYQILNLFKRRKQKSSRQISNLLIKAEF